MKRNVSVVCVCSAPNCCDTEQRSASQPGSVASGTYCIIIIIIIKRQVKIKYRKHDAFSTTLCCRCCYVLYNILLPVILGSRPDQRYARGWIGKYTFGRNDYEFRTSNKKSTSLYTIYLNNGEGADFKFAVKLVTVFAAWKDSVHP
jgi:hypothetical protein